MESIRMSDHPWKISDYNLPISQDMAWQPAFQIGKGRANHWNEKRKIASHYVTCSVFITVVIVDYYLFNVKFSFEYPVLFCYWKTVWVALVWYVFYFIVLYCVSSSKTFMCQTTGKNYDLCIHHLVFCMKKNRNLQTKHTQRSAPKDDRLEMINFKASNKSHILNTYRIKQKKRLTF